jgi:hypothetical protein
VQDMHGSVSISPADVSGTARGDPGNLPASDVALVSAQTGLNAYRNAPAKRRGTRPSTVRPPESEQSAGGAQTTEISDRRCTQAMAQVGDSVDA